MGGRPTPVTYRFACSRCAGRWTADYEIREVHDAAGQLQAVFFADGERTAPPLTQGRCRFCGSAAISIRRLVRPRS